MTTRSLLGLATLLFAGYPQLSEAQFNEPLPAQARVGYAPEFRGSTYYRPMTEQDWVTPISHVQLADGSWQNSLYSGAMPTRPAPRFSPAAFPYPAPPAPGLSAPAFPIHYDANRDSTAGAAAGTSSGCEADAGCCDGCCDDCCPPVWAHRTGVFAEFLYLRPRDAEVAYGVPIDGGIVPPPAVPVQVGAIGVADPDYQPGFRAGFSFALSDCSSLVATYTMFQSSTNDAIFTNAPLVVRSLLLHPATANANADFLNASAASGVDFDLIDIDYRGVWSAGDLYAVNFLVGARYTHMDQDFIGTFLNTGTVETVASEINFDGGGLRFGIDGERHAACSGFLVYGKGNASFVAGDFRARYFQGSTADPIIVDTSWQAGRVVTMLDIEVGAGWQSKCGRLRFTLGYLISAWFNTVNTDEWIGAVRSNNFVDLGDNMTFDGLTARAEFRF